jgi:hypothetical protein
MFLEFCAFEVVLVPAKVVLGTIEIVCPTCGVLWTIYWALVDVCFTVPPLTSWNWLGTMKSLSYCWRC